MKLLVTCAAAAASLVLSSGLARADTYQNYALAWSGDAFGNGAVATGTMTLDLTTLINPTVPGGLGGSTYYDIVSDITALSVTVSGASSGNGVYTLADLCGCSSLGSKTYWNTNLQTINMSGDVLAQLLNVGGDFNLFFTAPGPQGSNVLVLTTDALSGDPMAMREFSPTGVPEPAAWALMLVGVGLAGAGLRGRKAFATKTRLV